MAFTSKAPHTCKYCQQITLDLTHSGSITQFSCGVEEAIGADEAGCPLFHGFIDDLQKNTSTRNILATGGILNLGLRYLKEDLPFSPAIIEPLVRETSDDEWQHVFFGKFPSLSLWTCEGDAASADISTRPYELDNASVASVDFARNCIQSCQLNHDECRRSTSDLMAREGPTSIDPKAIPSRLLLITSTSSGLHVELVGKGLPSAIKTNSVALDGFAILSYCWGGPQPVELTRRNILDFGKGIQVSKLPKSLRDAAWFTHKIGLKYLWIDALCILQDNNEDKVREISRMELYYGQSTVTICAASAAKCTDGFLTSREEDPATYAIGPIQLRAKTSSGTLGFVQGTAESDYFNNWKPQEPITLRGWTLQEALLSRRILIFSSDHLHFTCTVANATCGGIEPKLKPRVMTGYESRVEGVHTLSGLRSYPVREVWTKVVDSYTIRGLGFPTDKLPAVSALASSLIPMARARNQKVEYLAGLMLDASEPENYYWRTEFLWRVHHVQSTCHIPIGSPSWSWSSVNGRISMYVFSQPKPWSSTDGVQLLEYGVDLENEIAPFGVVKGGFVKIHTRTKSLNASIKNVDYTIAMDYDPSDRMVDPNRTLLALCPDTPKGVDRIELAIQGELDLLLVELIPFYENYTSPAGLIVAEASGPNRYVRVGIYECQQRDHQTGAELAMRKSFFDNSSVQDVYIV